MQDLGLDGVETCWGQRYRYQTPLNLLIYRGPFGNYGRVTESLKAKEVGEFGDEGPLPHLSRAASSFVVDQEKIAQRLVNIVEPNVAGNLPQGAIVLDQRIKEQIRGKGIAQAGSHQIGFEGPGRQVDVIASPGDIGSELVVGLKTKLHTVSTSIAVPKTPR